MKTIRVFAWIATILTFLAIVQGRIVRVTGASKACPDWPLCNGALFPTMTPLVFLEWLHRLFVITSAFTVVLIVLIAWLQRSSVRKYALVCLGLELVAALIGGVGILVPLGVAWAAADQAFAMLFFGSLVFLTAWTHAPALARAWGAPPAAPAAQPAPAYAERRPAG